MSKLYGNTTIYCSCSSKRSDYQTVLTSDRRRLHSVNDLSFCPSCQLPKCRWCFKTETVKKYCCSCLTDYSATNEIHCTKNCFTCPSCESMLSITPIDDAIDGVNGKKFLFRCTYCEYAYETEVILKPKPLFSIIKGEFAKQNKELDTFNTISSVYAKRLKYETLKEQLSKDLRNGITYSGISQDVIRQLRELKVTVPRGDDFMELDDIKLSLESVGPTKFNEDEDYPEESYGTPRKLVSFNMFGTSSLPIPKTLSSRNSIECSDCNNTLLMPNEDLVSTKFQVRWNANEFLPSVSISATNGALPTTIESGKTYNFLINLVNPMMQPVKVVLSSPFQYVSDDVQVQTTIPVTNIKIGGLDPKGHVLRGIPTSELTRETKISRAELMMRTGRAATAAKSQDTSMDFLESLVDSNDNWYSVPIEIAITTDSKFTGQVKVPIFVNLYSSLPDAMKGLKFSKKELNVGFWSVALLGPFQVTHDS